MRIIVVFIFLILISAGLYTAYGIFSFEPEKPAPLVFQEPTVESLRNLGILPKDSKDAIALSPEQQDQTKKAVTQISTAITTYQGYEAQAPLRLKDTLNILTNTMSAGRLPAYFLSVTDTGHPQRVFEALKFNPLENLATSTKQTALNCTPQTYVLMGADLDDTLACNANTVSGDKIFIGGPGNDTISDTVGNRIVNAGAGNDTITLGPGRSIIVLDENWGEDKLNVDCKGAAVNPSEIPKNFPVPWISAYTNFIVLSPRIPKNSVKWNGNVLSSLAGDSLSVNQNCFTLIGQ